MTTPAGEPCEHAHTPEDPARRRLFSRLALGVTGALGAAAAWGPLGILLDPLLRKRATPDADATAWSLMGPLERFPVGGPPVRVALKEDQTDAWLSRPGVPVGQVIIQRPDAETFLVHSSVCPHLGCAVGFDAPGGRFRCPCHKSSFALNGELTPNPDGATNPAPRGMDPLPWRVSHGRLEVQWVRFKPGVPEREPVA